VIGCAATLVIAERTGDEGDHVRMQQRVGPKPPKLKAPRGPGRGVGETRTRNRIRLTERACRALAAAGHPVRATLLTKLLEGPATHKALQRATKATAGPLYHHINQLRLAGLILPKRRDLYELTRGGRNLVLGAACLEPMIKDRRRRPVGASD